MADWGEGFRRAAKKGMVLAGRSLQGASHVSEARHGAPIFVRVNAVVRRNVEGNRKFSDDNSNDEFAITARPIGSLSRGRLNEEF